MPSVTLSEAHLSFGDRTILDAVSFTLNKGSKIALHGANGSGKTTLMRVMAGELAPDGGGVHREKGTRLSYLPQSGPAGGSGLSLSATLLEEMEKAFAPGRRLLEELGLVEENLSRQKGESPEARRLMVRHQELAESLEASGYHRRRERIERVLAGLGFAREEFTRQVGELSQGWQMRIGLARILCEQADFLLLDEPTNYLDLEARTWLEQFLSESPAGIMVVSHDRYFLDTTTSAVAELYQGRLSLYPGSFSAYEQRRAQELEQIAEAYERQQEQIARMELFIRRFRYKASKARQVQSRIGRIERMSLIEPPPVPKRLHFAFPEPPHSGRLSLRLEGLGKAYGTRVLFKGLDLELDRGQKLVLVGPNGAGKSTLMRILAGREQPSEGSVSYGSGVSLGYYSPDLPEEQGGAQSLIERLEARAPGSLVPQLRTLLGAFLFHGDDVFKPVSVLSGGERSRLALLELLLDPANCLLLDEPTNHLDMTSKDVLLEALIRYPGTLVFVSHDRYFIERLATRVLALEGGRARPYPGDYAYYLWRKEREGEEGIKPVQAPAGVARTPLAPAPAPGSAPSPAQAARLQAKRRQSDLRRLQREEERILAELEKLAAEAGALEGSLAEEKVYRDGERVKRIKEELAANGRRQGELTRSWEELEKKLQALR